MSEKQLFRSGALKKMNVGFALFADIRFSRTQQITFSKVAKLSVPLQIAA